MPGGKDTSAIGAMGTDIIVIGKDKEGSFHVKLNYKRQWENTQYPACSLN
jgi:predicted secreted protein